MHQVARLYILCILRYSETTLFNFYNRAVLLDICAHTQIRTGTQLRTVSKTAA